jgi:hypothetical protein
MIPPPTPPVAHRFPSGAQHTLAVLANGSVYVLIGANNAGQLIVPGTSFTAVSVAAGDLFWLSLTSSGSVVGWGSGAGASPPAGLAGMVTAVSAQGGHALALLSNGSVVGWGENGFGQSVSLGRSDVMQISAGSTHSLALRDDRTPVVWGSDGRNHRVRRAAPRAPKHAVCGGWTECERCRRTDARSPGAAARTAHRSSCNRK